MTQFLETLGLLLASDSAGLFVIGLTAIAMLHTACALGRTRQWYLLPVLFGLTALAGFLLNPLADSNTLMDLKTTLTSYETLTLLCVAQFLLVSVSVWLGLRIEGGQDVDRSSVWLGVVSAVPPPVLVIAMLLMEQVALTASIDARPETVGREIGLSVAALLTVAAAIAMCLPSRLLAAPHGLLSIAMILACMFVPFLQDPLPQSMALVDWESLKLLACLAPILAVAVLVGGWPSVRTRKA